MKNISNFFTAMVMMTLAKTCWSYDCLTDGRTPAFAQAMESDIAQACKILGKINLHVRLAERAISNIADSNVPFDRKIGREGLINTTIDEYFQNGKSIIQVTSLKHPNHPQDREIIDYLNMLADLSEGPDRLYDTVELSFNDNPEVMEPAKLDNDTFEISVFTWQIFKGCKTADQSSEKCNSDITHKIFIANIINKQTDPKIKIVKVEARETFSERYFNDKMPQIIFKPDRARSQP